MLLSACLIVRNEAKWLGGCLQSIAGVADEIVVVDTGSTDDTGALVVGRLGARANVTEGEMVEVAVDTRSLHFFDPDTGLGIYDQVNEKGATT